MLEYPPLHHKMHLKHNWKSVRFLRLLALQYTLILHNNDPFAVLPPMKPCINTEARRRAFNALCP